MNNKRFSVRLLEQRLKELQALDNVNGSDTDGGAEFKDGDGTGGGNGGVNERISRLEGMFEGFRHVVEGLRHGQNWTLGAIGILAALFIGYSAYSLNRLDVLNEKVSALPAQINSNLNELTRTMAVAITAAKQPMPQVIPVPAPKEQRASKP